MKKILISLFLIIIIAIVTLIVVFRSSSGFRSMNLVPDDAIVVAESEDPVQSWDKIIHSKAWKDLSRNPLVVDLNTAIQSFDSLVNSSKLLMKFMGEKPVTISQHLTAKNGYDFLYIVEIGKAGLVSNPEKILRTFLSAEEYEITSRAYKEETIIEILDLEEKEYYFISFIQGKLIFSYDPLLVESSINTLGKGTIGKNVEFLKVYSKLSGKGLVRLYINNKNLGNYMSSFSPEIKSDITNKQVHYTAVSFDITKEGMISMEGYASLSDSVKRFYQPLLQKGSIQLKTAEVIPKRLASLVKVNFKNANDYFYSSMQMMGNEEFESYCKGVKKVEKKFKISIDNDVFSWMDKEIILLQTKPSNLGRKNEFAAVIHAVDSTEAADKLSFLWRQIKRNSPVKVKIVNYKGYKIDYIAFPGLLKMMFGKLLNKIEKPYFTQIGNNVIISNHPQTIKNLIDDYLGELTLKTAKEYKDFCDKFKSRPALFAYCEPPVLYYNMQDLLSPDSWQSLKENKEYFTCFSQAGIAVNFSDEMIHFEVNIHYNPDVDEWNKEYYSTYDMTSMFKRLGQSEKHEDSEGAFVSDTIPDIIIEQLDAGKQVEYFDDGSVKREFKIKDGILDGSYKEYHPNGKVKIKGAFDRGEPTGKWKYFDEEGKLIKVDKY